MPTIPGASEMGGGVRVQGGAEGGCSPHFHSTAICIVPHPSRLATFTLIASGIQAGFCPLMASLLPSIGAGHGTFSRQAAFEDLDQALVADYCARIGATADPRDALYSRDLLLRREDRLVPTLGCVLLFAQKPQRYLPRCGLDFLKFEGTRQLVGQELNIIKREIIERPLPRRYLQEHRWITNQEYRRLMGVDRQTAWRQLTRLVEAGVLVKEGKGRYTRYRLPSL